MAKLLKKKPMPSSEEMFLRATREFVELLADQLPWPSRSVRYSPTTVVWTVDSTIQQAHVFDYSHVGIPRISINLHTDRHVDALKTRMYDALRAEREFARDGGSSVSREPSWTVARVPALELTATCQELPVLTSWIPEWLKGHYEPSRPIPVPPVRTHVFGKGWRETRYAWTEAAWKEFARHRPRLGLRPDHGLPWYAIHADDVREAPPLVKQVAAS